MSDRNYIVLGAAGGIGSRVCRRVHAAGARLMLVGRTAESLGVLVDEGGGSIVLVPSAAARIGLPNHEAIAAATADVIGLLRSAAATYAAHRFRGQRGRTGADRVVP